MSGKTTRRTAPAVRTTEDDDNEVRGSRDELRAALLASAKPASKLLKFRGQKVEVRQPSVEAVLNQSKVDEEGRRSGPVDMLIQCLYVPGTNDRVFEEGDRDALMNMPFSDELTDIFNTLTDLGKANFPEQKHG